MGVCRCGFCNVWMCVCVDFVTCGCLYVLFLLCGGVLVICALVSTEFWIVCTVFLYSLCTLFVLCVLV